ncbi:hypothetical protein TNCV_4893141 [Trichonephila clavipes]|nr:hypothetical protein TNCV_4893141 [Trichonephila clavipes]
MDWSDYIGVIRLDYPGQSPYLYHFWDELDHRLKGATDIPNLRKKRTYKSSPSRVGESTTAQHLNRYAKHGSNGYGCNCMWGRFYQLLNMKTFYSSLLS